MIESVDINKQEFVGKGKILAKQAIANERPVVVIKQSFVFCKTDGGEATRRQDGNMRRIVRSIGNTNLQGMPKRPMRWGEFLLIRNAVLQSSALSWAM